MHVIVSAYLNRIAGWKDKSENSRGLSFKNEKSILKLNGLLQLVVLNSEYK